MSMMKLCCSTNYVSFFISVGFIYIYESSELYFSQFYVRYLLASNENNELYIFSQVCLICVVSKDYWCCMVNEINYIIFYGCIALDCWLVKKFSYSLSVGITIVTDHLLGIYVSRYIFVWHQTVRRYIYVCRYKLYRRHLQRHICGVGIHLYQLIVCRYNGFYRQIVRRCIGAVV